VDTSDLSKRQRDILDFILDTVRDRGYPPSVREIGEATGLSSPSTVHAHLGTLQERGYLRRDPSKPRAIDVRRHAGDEAERLAAAERAQAQPAHDPGDADRPDVGYVPIYGSIAAGPTSLAEQLQEGMLPLPRDLIGDVPHFALNVRGESMIGAGILDGDLAVVRVQPDASNGDIVAAQVEGPTGEAEATVKRFRRSGGRIMLHPENPELEPFEAPGSLRVLGKVVAIFRRL
jgi:repressor LexA